ncbi:MAG: acetylglutamate kinase [Bacteroidetes bacterium]|nr:acetylglutamate kinase [Bacteroidota bacterium]
MQTLDIIKIGGDIINHEVKLKQFLSMISEIKTPMILIHGGGKLLDQLATQLGVEQQMVDGRRITDAATLELATMVYAGGINKKIVAICQSQGLHAVGLSGADNNCLQAQKRSIGQHDFGFVGDITKEGVNTKFISLLLSQNIMPVFCSITHDNQGQLFNTNADTLASVLAQAMSAYYEVQLRYCFEKNGVLRNVEDEESVIPSINSNEYKTLQQQGIISQGMIPKLDNAFAAIQGGVNRVIITHALNILKSQQETAYVGTKIIR